MPDEVTKWRNRAEVWERTAIRAGKEVERLRAELADIATDVATMAERPCDHSPCFDACMRLGVRINVALERKP